MNYTWCKHQYGCHLMYSTFHSTPFGHGPSHQQHIDIESINGDSQEQCSLNNFAVAGTKGFLNLSEESVCQHNRPLA